ncbi:MAG: 50S ribosomal protein L1 [Chloroflexi bacterium]|nr:50S ribosomal protein L1 [Chloroflexota bacterium]
MAKHGKKYLEAQKLVGETTPRQPDEAVALAKKAAYAKFDETVELHLYTFADPRHADQQLREIASLPHGVGRKVRVMVFAEGEAARVAREAGADYVADDATYKRIEEGWSDFEVSIATPDMMGKIGRLGRFLGRKGLMPNPRTGTVVQAQDIGKAIGEAKKGRVELKMDKTAIIHAPIGKASFEEKALLENLASVISTVIRAKPAGVKGPFLKSATIATTMGPGIKLDLPALQALRVE